MRLTDRSKVDLPQPDGPIRAVTCRAGTVRLMSESAWFGPYQKENSRASSATTCGFDASDASRAAAGRAFVVTGVDRRIAGRRTAESSKINYLDRGS